MQEKADGGAHKKVRGFAQAARHLVHGPNARQIGEGGQKGDFGLALPQYAHDIALRLRLRGFAGGARHDFVEMVFRGRVERYGEEPRIFFRQTREVGRAGEDAAQECGNTVREVWRRLQGSANPFEPAAAAARFIVHGAFAQASGKGAGLSCMARHGLELNAGHGASGRQVLLEREPHLEAWPVVLKRDRAAMQPGDGGHQA